MHLIFRDSQGTLTEGVVLALSTNRLRVITRWVPDTIQLDRVYGEWQTEDGTPVEIEALVATEHAPQGLPRTLSAV